MMVMKVAGMQKNKKGYDELVGIVQEPVRKHGENLACLIYQDAPTTDPLLVLELDYYEEGEGGNLSKIDFDRLRIEIVQNLKIFCLSKGKEVGIPRHAAIKINGVGKIHELKFSGGMSD